MTRTRGVDTINAEALEAAVHAADPAALVVAPWLMRQVIAADRDLSGPFASIPHAHCYPISRSRLQTIIDEENLPFPDNRPLQDNVLLLARADSDWLARQRVGFVLQTYWRLLFHARVDAALSQSLPSGRADVDHRIEQLGRSAFNEARFVLRKERYIGIDAPEREVWKELAVVFLELYHFAPQELRHFFPAIEDHAAAFGLFSGDVDSAALFRATRPAGAPEPEPQQRAAAPRKRRTRRLRFLWPRRDARQRAALVERADRAAASGNLVGSAVNRLRACRWADEHKSLQRQALDDLDLLVSRLAAALGLDDTEAARWRTALWPVLTRAASGWWNYERRLLHDLQKVCVDHEREIYSINLLDFVRSFGRRPLRRPVGAAATPPGFFPVPAQRLVLIVKHLHSAQHRLVRVKIARDDRAALEALLRSAVHHTEHLLREQLRPEVRAALDEGGLEPRNQVERNGAAKLTDELLDGIVHRGYSNLGDLRDAIARNSAKLPDLSGPVQFVRGDQLIQIDQRLARRLEGVHRRGEVYLRFFQRLSSLLFGNPVGRWITRFILVPFGGAFLLLEGLDHTVGALFALGGLPVHTSSLPSALALGVFLLGAIYWPGFRPIVGTAFGAIRRSLYFLLIGGPRWLLGRPWLQAALRSRPARLLLRYVLKPGFAAALAWLVIHHPASTFHEILVLAGVFLAANLIINSRPGRAFEQAATHALGVLWTRVTAEILAGIIRGIANLFANLLDRLDRTLYAVDEWLRFRSGQSTGSLLLKTIVGSIWAVVTYVTRFIINLLVEPQVNPIKHFPVVTVSHKLLLPTIPLLAKVFIARGTPVEQAYSMAAGIIWCIPGIFGFLAWEMKENWKLYRGNRSRRLKKVIVGSHGESIAQLLRPGFHSGTVPKIYARIRRAQRRGVVRRADTRALKEVQKLHHVHESVEHFLQRELVALLNSHPAFDASPVSLGEVKLTVTRIQVDLLCPQLDPAPAPLVFEHREGYILADIECPGWTSLLTPAQANLSSFALAGIFKLAGVDLVRRQVAAAFDRPVEFDVRAGSLIVWPKGSPDEAVIYPLDGAPMLPSSGGIRAGSWPTLQPSAVLFRMSEISWDTWVAVWSARASGDSAIPPLPPILPRADHAVAATT